MELLCLITLIPFFSIIFHQPFIAISDVVGHTRSVCRYLLTPGRVILMADGPRAQILFTNLQFMFPDSSLVLS